MNLLTCLVVRKFIDNEIEIYCYILKRKNL